MDDPHANSIKPGDGDKTHPLSDHALRDLRSLLPGPLARSEFNPGVVNRLLRGDLVAVVDLPSPFKSHKGRSVEHLQLTTAGRSVLGEEESHG